GVTRHLGAPRPDQRIASHGPVRSHRKARRQGGDGGPRFWGPTGHPCRPGSGTAPEAKFGLQALDLVPQAADQPERLAVHPVVTAVMLDPAQLEEGIIVENQFCPRLRPRFTEEAEPAI